MRAANATQSASETPQRLASISSLLTSNSEQPNFTFGMEVPNSYTRMRLFGTRWVWTKSLKGAWILRGAWAAWEGKEN
jgi:hypothetical protein